MIFDCQGSDYQARSRKTGWPDAVSSLSWSGIEGGRGWPGRREEHLIDWARSHRDSHFGNGDG
jgi:hypothetical protein